MTVKCVFSDALVIQNLAFSIFKGKEDDNEMKN